MGSVRRVPVLCHIMHCDELAGRQDKICATLPSVLLHCPCDLTARCEGPLRGAIERAALALCVRVGTVSGHSLYGPSEPQRLGWKSGSQTKANEGPGGPGLG